MKEIKELENFDIDNSDPVYETTLDRLLRTSNSLSSINTLFRDVYSSRLNDVVPDSARITRLYTATELSTRYYSTSNISIVDGSNNDNS